MSELLTYLQENDESFKSKSRLSSLYSDFSNLKSSNPDGYDANVKAWRSALLRACRAGKTPGNGWFTLKSGDVLDQALERKIIGKPLALGAVLNEAVAAKEFYPLREFLDSKSSIYAKRWAPSMEDMAMYMMSFLGYNHDKRDLTGYDFVVIPILEEASDKVLSQVCKASATYSSLIYTMETFTEAFQDCLGQGRRLNSSDISVLLVYLYRDKKAADMKLDKTGTTVIKFSRNPPVLPDPIDANDSTIGVLHTLSMSLRTQTDALQARIDALQQTAKQALSEGKKERALQALRLKKLADTTLRRREDSLLQVASVLDSIDDAIQNKETVNALERSSAVLHDLNQQIGGAERVDRVMEGLNEGMLDVEEVSGVMAALGGEGAVDEDELDEELEAMQRDVAEQKLPSVPAKEPLSEKKKQEETQEESVASTLGRLSLEEAVPAQ